MDRTEDTKKKEETFSLGGGGEPKEDSLTGDYFMDRHNS